MKPSLLAKLQNAIVEIIDDDSELSATEKGAAIRAHFEAEDEESNLEEFLSWFDDEE